MLLAVLALTSLWGGQVVADAAVTGEPQAVFTFQEVVDRAHQLAARPFEQPAEKTPEPLRDIGYDQWRDIRFQPEHALWRAEHLNFEVQFFLPSFLYETPVAINVVDATGVHPVPFSPDYFDYGLTDLEGKVPSDLGFAGFRIHYSINREDYKDEVIVFLGASYFRAVGKSQGYGLSARGLIIDTAVESGEQFPYFKEFWLVRPAPDDDEMTVYALLDSPSVTGAYTYTLKPGKETVVDVHSILYQRDKFQKLGIAPLTSMFYYGENTHQCHAGDFRPEVHDSDGLLIAFRSGEWSWGPLMNPDVLSVRAFETANPVGFGLLQRDLNFDHYQDLESRYERRPSVWVTPGEDWGAGRIELIQIPTRNEYNDNIIAFWVPKNLPEPGQPIAFSYKLSWYAPQGTPHTGGVVLATRTAAGKDRETRKFLIDFAGGKLEPLPKEAFPEGVVAVSEGAQIVDKQLQEGAISGSWRLVFDVRFDERGPLERVLPDKRPPVEIRAFLREGHDVLTETWSYAVHSGADDD